MKPPTTLRPMLKTRTKRVLAALANPRSERETASKHVRNAIQVLENLLEFGALDTEDRKDVRAAMHRLWLALRKLNVETRNHGPGQAGWRPRGVRCGSDPRQQAVRRREQ